MANRKDSKNRVLRTGESERKEGFYQYRYTNNSGKRCYVYADSLTELRKKEKEINYLKSHGGDYVSGSITAIELVEKDMSLRKNLKLKTREAYESIINSNREHKLLRSRIKDIKKSDVQKMYIELYEEKYKYSSISVLHAILKHAFKMAVDEGLLIKNVFDFELGDVVSPNREKRIALTKEQQEDWLEFLKTDKVYKRYYNINVVLLETGLRVSELCGLTKSDLDFENRRIYINHQLIKTNGKELHVTSLKTDSGKRVIPMSAKVYDALKSELSDNNYGKHVIVGGIGGFVFLTTTGNPKTAIDVEKSMKRALGKYNQIHQGTPITNLTPHVLRHSYCSNMYHKVDIKTLQYLMGHKRADVTLDIYTHITYEYVEQKFAELIDFEKIS